VGASFSARNKLSERNPNLEAFGDDTGKMPERPPVETLGVVEIKIESKIGIEPGVTRMPSPARSLIISKEWKSASGDALSLIMLELFILLLRAEKETMLLQSKPCRR